MESSTSRKRHSPGADWAIEFEDASSLRAIVDAVAAVMQRVTFKVQRNRAGLYVLAVDGADLGMTCCVSARLQIEENMIDVGGTGGDFFFCVDCKHVQTALDSTAASHGTLVIEGVGERVHVRVRVADTHTHDETSELKTFVDSERPTEIRPLEFSTRVEIDLAQIKEIIKKARKWHAETMRMRIELDRTYSRASFSFKGDADHEQRFYNQTQTDEDGSMVVRAASDGGDARDGFAGSGTHHFEGVFLIDRIDSFVRILPTRMVNAFVMRGMPIMFTHTFGASASEDESYIRYLVAPINEDE